MVEIYLLEQLDAFRRAGTLSAAAEYLHLAQPSLSRSMQKIEDELGVPLFDRHKNRLELNDTGMLASEYAARILDSENEMERHIRSYDRSLHTLTIGSCAPGPLMRLLPQATGTFSDMTISSAIEPEDLLLQKLRDSEYQLAVLPFPADPDEFYCRRYITEQLYLSVNNFHPAASYHSIKFRQMDGQNFIMYAQVGIWETVVRSKMPHARFLKQEDLDAVSEITGRSDLPSFSSSITLQELPQRKNGHINIPFSDKEASITFYIACAKRAPQNILHFLKDAGA